MTSTQPVPPPPPPPQPTDLMLKALQQQQMIEAEKQREAQQKLMQQQQIALMEAQRTEHQKRMMMEQQQQCPPPPPMLHSGMSAAPPLPPNSMVTGVPPRMHGPPQMHTAMPTGQPPMPGQVPLPPPSHILPPGQVPAAPVSSQQHMVLPQMVQAMPGHIPVPASQSHPGQMLPQMMPNQGLHGHTQGGPVPVPVPVPGPPPGPPGPPSSQYGIGLGPQTPIQQGVVTPVINQGPGPVIGDRGQGSIDRSYMDGGHLERGPVLPENDDRERSHGEQDRVPRGPMMMENGSRGTIDGGPRSMGDRPQEGGSIGAAGQDRGSQGVSDITRPQVPSSSLQHGPRGPPMTGMEPRPPQPLAPPGQREIRLPHALEKVLEFKTMRAQEFGFDAETPEGEDNKDELLKELQEDADEIFDDEGVDDSGDVEVNGVEPADKDSKNKRKKKKKKRAKKQKKQPRETKPDKETEKRPEEEVHIEYVQEQLELDPTDPNYHTFAKIFEAFKITEAEKAAEKPAEKKEVPKADLPVKSRIFDDDEDAEEKVVTDEDTAKISKKKLKKLTRLSVAQLKQLVTRPDVVEMHDVTARDPRLLVHLKATRNTVPVPRHWCYKRKYLQGKRGIEKPPFELPDFIRATGIEDMRAALQEKEEQKNLKAKMREKVRPKLGKIDIDYQKLHDAFFRFQTKPKMTIHGDLYYESKEFETRLKEKKPGNLTDDLRVALGMPVGMNAERVPPPWLIAMQRYGPPPSYPNLKIPGLNAPIPEGCSFGYHAGGWGKPPVDEMGKPLYGDVFGTQGGEFSKILEEEDVDKSLWGELESESESESESEEEEEEQDDSGLVTPAEGLVTPSGLTSVPVGVETPDMIELRKRRIEDAMDQGGDTPALYTVLPEKKTTVGAAMMGSAHIYDMSAVQTVKKGGEKGGTAEGVEVTLNPEELDLDTAAMQAKYDETVREQQSQLEKEDLSDMVAAHAAKQRKRKKQQADSSKSGKRYKDFKF
ncbi:hypothetical protein C0Q70_13886 [Pomacea canaliculata]|uniref:PSP proline-rich domain-containing protein n=2 Tax=Pomacea canaliculata TaxID=400727 RepID=A0A2T7NYH8_POMCA|nr:hypothetical protein C0Q70_13886 [Pomacea canaliculata]